MSIKIISGGFALLLFALGTASALADGDGGVYELRTYTTNEGKLDDLHARFKNHTMALFEKHGMKNIAYWVPTDRPNVLIYVIEHKDIESAPGNWQAFAADPDWQTVYAASRENGALIANIDSVFMTKTSYSPQ